MTVWLEVIGTSSRPLRDDWGSHAPPLLRSASFAKNPGEGFALGLLDVDRTLRRSVTQKSHIRFKPAEFRRACELFGV